MAKCGHFLHPSICILEDRYWCVELRRPLDDCSSNHCQCTPGDGCRQVELGHPPRYMGIYNRNYHLCHDHWCYSRLAWLLVPSFISLYHLKAHHLWITKQIMVMCICMMICIWDGFLDRAIFDVAFSNYKGIGSFWLCVLASPIVGLIPRFLITVSKQHFRPSDIYVAREAEKFDKLKDWESAETEMSLLTPNSDPPQRLWGKFVSLCYLWFCRAEPINYLWFCRERKQKCNFLTLFLGSFY